MTLPRGMPGFRGLSHLSPAGDARMVDVSAKAETAREAVARVTVAMKPATLAPRALASSPRVTCTGSRARPASSPPSGRPT